MATLTTLSATTIKRRQQLKSLQDEFTTFSWGGYDAFENFGAFIINEKKGSLKFYNGPGFSNEYAKPQFDNTGGLFQGVQFNKQTISFTIGVYWISIEDYRKMINWLDPLKTDYLQFGFDKKFRYDVKLSKIADSTRWIVGRENGEPRYYTELQLNFDIQGTPCAKGMNSYEFVGYSPGTDLTVSNPEWKYTEENYLVTGKATLFNRFGSDFVPSDLETPFQANFSLNLQNDYAEANYFPNDSEVVLLAKYSYNGVRIEEQGSYDDTTEELILTPVSNDRPTEYNITFGVTHKGTTITLCNLTLENIAFFLENGYKLNFKYFSETGLLFLSPTTTSNPTLVTMQTHTDSGEYLIKHLSTTKFMLPGEFNYPGFYTSNEIPLVFFLQFSKRTKIDGEWVSAKIDPSAYKQAISIECYPRTNVI